MSQRAVSSGVGGRGGLRVRVRLALLAVGCAAFAGLPSVAHGQGSWSPQYPKSVDPYEVIAFEHPDYTGYFQSFKLDPTKRQLLVPFLDESLDGKINSIRVGEKVGVVIFSQPKFQHSDPSPGATEESHPSQIPYAVRSLIVYHREIGPVGVAASESSDGDGRFFPLFEDWSEAKVCWKSLQDLDGETEFARIFPHRKEQFAYGKVHVTLFDRPDCQGDWITLPGAGGYATDFQLNRYDWDEKARSLEVRWEGPVPPLQTVITGTATLPSKEHLRAPAAPTEARAPSASDLEQGFDRPGSDLRAFELDGGPEQCRQACAAEQQCRAFTWVRPGVQGPQARCWLKSDVPAAVPNEDCVSGVRTGQSASGMLPIEPIAPSSQQQGPAPVEQAASAGFPMLAEITLAPGDPPATYRYVASATGPHRIIAAWGSPVGLHLEVLGDGPDPWVGEGNPATVRFEAVGGMEYRVRLRPVGSLPVTSVLQLRGGLVK